MSMKEHKGLIATLSECASMCDECVYNVCLGDPEMKPCGQACLDCADTCHATAVFVSRGSRFVREKLSACADVCDYCAAECEKFPDSEEMVRCAEICRTCAEQCRSAGQDLAAAA